MCVGQPFDLTKTRLQTAPAGMYNGMGDVVRQTLAKDGVRGCVSRQRYCSDGLLSKAVLPNAHSFYRGMASPLAGVVRALGAALTCTMLMSANADSHVCRLVLGASFRAMTQLVRILNR